MERKTTVRRNQLKTSLQAKQPNLHPKTEKMLSDLGYQSGKPY